MNVTENLTTNHYLVTHSVGARQQGMRLDTFLKQRYRKRSREQLKRAIGIGAVSVRRNQGPHLTVGRPKPSSHLVPGDEVLVMTERKPEPFVRFDYQILFEDEALFVINKPPNLPVHPAGRYFFNTLLIHLKTQGHQTPLQADQDYYLVHRIDKETSGVLVLAKQKEACTHITRQFAARTTQKRYLAIVKGAPPDSFSIDLALKRTTTSIIQLKMMIASEEEGGQPAHTHFKRIGVWGAFALVECFPKTGRQHQIRIHLEAAGYPIVGDKLYGLPESEALRFYERQNLTPEAEAKLLLPRHALHASWIQFVHPITGKKMEFHAPFPEEFQNFLNQQNPSNSASHLSQLPV